MARQSVPSHGMSPIGARSGGLEVSDDRTWLLACDGKNNVLAAVGPREKRQLRYSPYGHRSGSLFLTLGFNGELHERETGWQILGQGYRAYNPVLMRFHSPDSLSPFGAGGVNSYAYSVGDPVNKSDPTGHFIMPLIRGISRLLQRLPRFFEWWIGYKSKPISNLVRLARGSYVYEDAYKGGRRLTIDTHGVRSAGRSYVTIGDQNYNPKRLVNLLRTKRIPVEKYDSVRLLICSSGDGGRQSFAQKFADLLQKPVKGFEGSVAAEHLTDQSRRSLLVRNTGYYRFAPDPRRNYRPFKALPQAPRADSGRRRISLSAEGGISEAAREIRTP